ncbi:MAG TPA: hypothetical protein VHY09_12480 [Candidatus Methylacidiphilales bacterium]|jgi:hypothetical protein|nr:hypothetical protein [Candidatus Methylacidiphilales bacterium]
MASLAWRQQVRQWLPLLGHRNWIAIVDSAYPWQVAPGVETVATGAAQLNVASFVLGEVAKAPHVRPEIFLDAELERLPEKDAPGIEMYRHELKRLLGAQQASALAHEKIIAMLDEAGKSFRVLVLKSTLVLPYTSIFLRLDCGYWSAEAERRLRRKS